ncbi:MAG TPA: adenylate/guanylate cyclase domain-containing protein [Gaiellales bacterium]|nr:adenylate/guanylate cyclase domain-containing protein [Gaiellales bacterium]
MRPAGVDERQERRVVTVLFADLAGSTALGEHLDPEDVRQLQGELFEVLHTEVERFGGTTEKFIGDAILAVFGIPQTHEDDPERAVRAALSAHERFTAFADRVRAEYGAEVGLRIGVNTGDVVASREAAARGELMVSGDAVNVAARLQQNAEPGDVLVGERTHAATNRVISYGRRRDIDAKGQQAPVPAWAALAAPAEPTLRPVGLTAPFIGRDEEVAILGAVASRVNREHVPQLVTLFGQAGVGKSRLLAEVLERLPEARVLKGRCLPYGEGITYWSLAEAAKAEAGILDTDRVEAALQKLRTSVTSVVEDARGDVFDAIAWSIGFAVPGSPLITADPEYVRRSLADAWQRYLGASGRRQVTVLVVEDVHWASAALLDLVEHLADTLAETRVLVVCTARPEFLDRRPTWGAGKQNATTLTLAPLSADESARLVSSLLGEAHMSESLRQPILTSGEGNPFFLEEMLQMLIEERALERRNGNWVATGRLSHVRIPDSVHGVIAARIDLLDAGARDALRRCSVVGRVFWPLAVDVDEQALAPLSRRGLVSPRPQSVMAGMQEFAFKHALTRDVAYGSLPRPERRHLHRRVAEWIQRVAPDRGAETAELAAYHYGEAIAYGEDDPAVVGRAYAVLLSAGESAMHRGAFVAARTQFEHAETLAADPGQRASALLPLAELDVTEARWQDAIDRLTIAEQLAEAGNPRMLSAVLALRSRLFWMTGRWDEALESANGAVSTLAGLPESAQLARALARRSQIEMLKNRHEAIEHSLEAIAVADRVGDVFSNVNARINLFTARASEGEGPDADEILGIVEAAASVGAHEEAYRAIVNFLWSALGFVSVDRIESVIAAGRKGRLPPPPVIAAYLELSVAAMLFVPAGRWAEADAILDGIDGPALSATSNLVWRPSVGGLALRRGDYAVADAVLADLGPLALASGEPQRIVPMASVVLPWLLLSGKREELRAVAMDVVAAVEGQWPAVLSLDGVLRTLFAAEEFELLAATTESLGRSPIVSRVGRLEISLMAAQGLTALAAAEVDEAATHLSAAVASLDELGFAYDSACLKLELAQALERAGETVAAAERRQEATVVFTGIGCVNPV